MTGRTLRVSDRPASAAQRQSMALAALSAMAVEEDDLDVLLREAVAHAADGIGAGRAELLEYRAADDGFLLRAGLGWTEDIVGRAVFAADAASPAAHILRTGEPLAIPSLSDQRRFALPAPLREHGGVALLAVPIRIAGPIYGVLEVVADRPRRFTTEDTAFLQTLANIVGAAVRRRNVERALREQDDRLRFGLTVNRTVAWDWDLATGISTRSDNAMDVFGLETGPVEAFTRTIHPEDRPRVEAAIAAAIRDGTLLDVEFRVLMPDGRLIWLAEKARLRRGADGRPTHLVGVCTDVTEHKQAEEALRASEARFRGTFEQAAVGLSHVGLDGRCLRVNQRFCEIVGYRPEELLSKSIQQITHPDDRDGDLSGTDRLLAGEATTYATEKRYIRKDGRPIWIRLTVSLVRSDQSGAPHYFICVVEDIDGQKKAETLIREREERLRAALFASGTGTYRRNLRGDLVDRDENLYRLYGIAPEEATGHICDLFDRVHPEDRAAVAAAIRRSEKEGADFDIDYRIVLPDGGLRWVSDKGKIFLDEQGRPLYMTGACVDVTERKQAEEHRKLLLAELNHRVKNTLAVAQSIAAQTLRRATSLEGFGESFTGRLHALATAHSLLTQGHWRSTRLEKVVRRALKAHGTSKRALDIAGPELSLSPKQTLGLSLVLHELATNAVKYGALSVSTGRVEVRWTVEDSDGGGRELRIDWIERDGPSATAPEEPGFGTKLIEHTVGYDLDGRTGLTYGPDGLRCRIAIPWDNPPGDA